MVPRVDRSSSNAESGTAAPAAAVSGPAPAAPVRPTAPSVSVDPIGAAGVVGQVVTAAVEQVARVVRPEAAVAIATEFTFPLALALAVLGYLLIQGHVDRRDPKLRVAPQHVVETLLPFKLEDEL